MNIEELIPRKSPLIIAAAYFAFGAHGSIDQRRKYTDQPYVVHCYHVARLLIEFAEGPITDEQIAAAILHDVVEDTPVTSETIHAVFGSIVGNLVDWLTDVSKLSDGNRKIRKKIDLDHTTAAPFDAKSIKLADLISNAPDITTNDPGFARTWLREKKALLDVLQDADQGLYNKAIAIYNECIGRLNEPS